MPGTGVELAWDEIDKRMDYQALYLLMPRNGPTILNG